MLRLAVVLAAFALWAASPAAAQERAFPLLHIAKSDSSNEVHYATLLRSDCRLAEDPIRAHWVRRSGPERTPRPLSWIEDRLLYGVRLVEAGEHRAVFTLAADDTRPVVVESSRTPAGCQVRARVKLLGEWVEPTRAFVDIRESELVPAISHVDLHARREDGGLICERIAKLRAAGMACGVRD